MEEQYSYMQVISSSEQSNIYDIAFNHYCNRMAMCCSNQLVTVWNKINDWKEWMKTADWKAHTNDTTKISWVHPEFGQALATCSADRSVAIWEEMLDNDYKIDQRWVRKTSLLGSNRFITDIKFAPKTVGLLLAVCSSDGFIRIFKALDVLDLSRWSLLQEVCYRYQPTCITWNPNGLSENYSTKYFRMDNIDEMNKDFGSIYTLYPRVGYEPSACIVVSQEPMIVVGFENENCKTEDKIAILLYAFRYQRWNKTEYSVKDKYLSKITDPVSDLAFAARLGRAYDILAVASKDIKIYTLYQIYNQSHSSFRFQFCLMYSFPCHHSSFLKLNWTPLGNILITSGDDGCVRLWKQCQVLNGKEENDSLRQKNTLQSNHLQYCWKTVKIIKISDL